MYRLYLYFTALPMHRTFYNKEVSDDCYETVNYIKYKAPQNRLFLKKKEKFG